jgi:hypothetical protein
VPQHCQRATDLLPLQSLFHELHLSSLKLTPLSICFRDVKIIESDLDSLRPAPASDEATPLAIFGKLEWPHVVGDLLLAIFL